jgi:tetratricopeptide (TPR) repeat protein
MKAAILALPLLAALTAGCAGLPHTKASPVRTAANTASAGPALNRAAQDELYLGVVSGLIKQKRYGAAIAFLNDYAAKTAPDARYEMLRGDAMLGANRHDEAVTAYAAALAYGTRAPAYNGIGRALSEQKRWSEAALNFRRATSLDPTNAKYLNNLGYAELQQELPSTAAAVLRQAHELQPGSTVIRNNLILAAAMSQDQAQYTALLGTIVDAKERSSVAHFAASWTGWGGPVAPKQKAVP